MGVALLCGLTGCVATKYQLSKKTTPPVLLNQAFAASEPIKVTLAALISYGGPGSWKREALWDEYVVTVQNQGDRPVTIDSTMLADAGGSAYGAGTDPWALEKQSKTLEQQYRARGEAFARAAAPGVLIVGTGALLVGSVAGGGIALLPVAGVFAAATIVALPVYYVAVLGINQHNKKAVMAEFIRRRLPLPLTLAPGETRTASLFYPMLRNPHALELSWSGETHSGQAVLALDFLQGLHVPAATAGPVARKSSRR
jgi:hypothetical protein